MCMVTYENAPSRLEAARRLSALIETELGLRVEPNEVLELFKRRWPALSKLAHAIHGGI